MWVPSLLHINYLYYRTYMANSAENKSFCEVPKYVINTRPHWPKLMKVHEWIAKIDEINVYKNHNIFELKALRGGMNVT